MGKNPTSLGEVMCKEKRENWSWLGPLGWPLGTAALSLCLLWFSFGQMPLPIPQFSSTAVDSKSL